MDERNTVRIFNRLALYVHGVLLLGNILAFIYNKERGNTVKALYHLANAKYEVGAFEDHLNDIVEEGRKQP